MDCGPENLQINLKGRYTLSKSHFNLSVEELNYDYSLCLVNSFIPNVWV